MRCPVLPFSSTVICNRNLNHTKLSSPNRQQINKLTTTNKSVLQLQNVTKTLEENQSGKSVRHFDKSKQGIEETGIATEVSHLELDNETCQASSRRTGTEATYCEDVRYLVPKDVNIRRWNKKRRSKSVGDEIATKAHRKKSMTHDYFSDCDSDSAWLDQPSPILLTSSPPQNAVKVPATRLPVQDVNSVWDYGRPPKYEDTKLDENRNILENGNDWEGDMLFDNIPDIRQEASDLFCKSLRDTTRYAKLVPETTNHVANVRSPDLQLYKTSPHNSYNGYRSTPDRDQTPINGHEYDKNVPTSGPIFVGGGLFLTEEDECSDYHRHETPTKEYSGTKQTMAGSLYQISNSNSLYIPNSGMTVHNHINSSRQRDQQTINGNARYYDRRSENGNLNFQYNSVISVDDAEYSFRDQKINISSDVSKSVSTPLSEGSQKSIEHSKMSSAVTSIMLCSEGNDSSETNNKYQQKTFSSGPRSLRKKQNFNAKMQFLKKTRQSDDDDDDATTLTMITTSDDAAELSSSSSSGSASTARVSVTSARSSKMQSSPRTPPSSADATAESFIIEKVEINVNKVNGFNGVLSPEERIASLQRSISTQSGKLRDRLNAVTDDESDIPTSYPKGNSSETTQFVEYVEPYQESELDMLSMNRYSPSEVSPSQIFHSRITQLRGEISGPRTSRSLSRIPNTRHSPTQSRRCRSLDRGLKSSFRSALSSTNSDMSGRRSLINFRRRNSLGSDSDVSPVSTISRSRLRKATSSNSLADQWKPKIDVAETLSALILNPVNGGVNDRKTLSDYLKNSSRSNSYERMTPSAEDVRWRKSKYAQNYSPSYQTSHQSRSGSSCGGRTPNHCLLFEEVKLDSLSISGNSSLERPRESKIVSKSQTPNRYPAVQASPRSISDLLPSPRRNIDAEPEVITIIDNDVTSNDITEHECTRRNSFIEAVTGASSENAYSSNSESLTDKTFGNGVETTSQNNFAIISSEVGSDAITITASDSAYHSDQNVKLHVDGAAKSIEIFPEEVNINLTTHPVSNDLAVAVIRRPSLRNQSVSSISSKKSNKKAKLASDKLHNSHSSSNQEFRLKNPHHSPDKKPTSDLVSQEPMYVNIPNPGKHRNDSLEDIVTVKCRNPRCRKEMCLEDGNSKFKSCHHCYTYYCSIQCRQLHWERHKMKCVFARVNSDCKKILRMGREDDVIKQAFTRVARTGYLSRGRGCVQVIFSCPERAEQFVSEGLFALESLPLYRTVNDLTDFQKRLSNTELIPDDLIETCESVYDAEKTYVLQVLIDIPKETLSLYNRPYRNRNSNGVYIHALNPIYKVNQESITDQELQHAPETLILTPPTTIPETWLTTSPSGFSRSTSTTSPLSQTSSPLNACGQSSVKDELRQAKRARQLCFINIQRKLREKGVTLRHQYPDVYRKLCAYVDTGTHFTPVVIYPQDTRSGKNFMCLVMPGSEPQILGWVQTPGLLDDIATG
ncbi:uncharacterized protein LOC120344177 isoform X2 [Styela clava]